MTAATSEDGRRHVSGPRKNSDDFRVSIIGRGWEGRELNGTSGDNESIDHHADQHDHRVRGLDWPEFHDSFDPFS